jgi:hypothetical protein
MFDSIFLLLQLQLQVYYATLTILAIAATTSLRVAALLTWRCRTVPLFQDLSLMSLSSQVNALTHPSSN